MILSRASVAFLLLAMLLCPPHLLAQQARWMELDAQARELERQGKDAVALPIAVEALTQAEAELGADNPLLSLPIQNLALVYDRLSRFAEAEPLYLRALQIHKKAFGPDTPLVAMDAESLAVLYFRQSRYAQAEPLFEQALHTQERVLGIADPGLAIYLANLGLNYMDEGKYKEAEPVYSRAVAIYEKTPGPQDLDLATSLNYLAHIYDQLGKYASAEPLYKRVLAIREKLLGPENASVAKVLNDLAAVEYNQGRYAEAEPLYQRALAILEKSSGRESTDVATALDNLGTLYDHQGRYDDAESLYQRALSIDQKALGASNPGVATDLNNLATLYFHQGQYDKAEMLMESVLRIEQQALGSDNRTVADALINLAGMRVRQGKYAEAEPLYQHALRIYGKSLDPDHPAVATALNNLAALYLREGKYADAETLYQRSLRIREKALGPEHVEVAEALNNLAALHVNQGKNADAEALYLRALAIYEKALGPDHVNVAITLNNLAQLYFNEGKFSLAEPRYRRALRIDEKALGNEHPNVAIALNNLALLFDRQGKYDDAQPLFERALRIDEKVLGPEQPDVATDLSNLALFYDHQGKYTDADPLFHRAFDNLFQQFQYNFTYMTENERLGFLDTVANDFPVYSSFVYRFRQQDPQLIGYLYNLLLWEKSLIVGSVADMRRQVEASGDVDATKLLGELSRKRTQIATLESVEPPNRDLWRKQIDQLQTEANDTERALVARSSTFAEQKKLERATWQQVRDALGPDDAAVEFARFPFYDKKWTDTSYYAALVVTRDTRDHPEYIFLGDQALIESDAVVRFRSAVKTRAGHREQAKLPGAQAYELLWKPLEKALAGKNRIYLSPDGVLNQVPLGIIPAPDGKLQMEKYDLRLLSSTRDILRSVPPRTASATALLVGDPVFDLSEDQQRAAMQKLALPQQETPIVMTALSPDERSRDLGNGSVLSRLPGTGAEVNAIAELMRERQWKTSVYTNELALKRVVEQASSPRVVHLATHGFFLPDQQIKTDPMSLGQGQSSVLEDPMLRSGLYFAGAGRTLAGTPTAQDVDNGVLTAMEAGSLNLRGTELVVLSACDTGQGDVENGEGVFGLRRALQEAGAQEVLMSLWSVPDKETLELMKGFYTKWLAGMEIHEALKEAQLETREKVSISHNGQDLPFYWGAFVLVGR